MSIALLGCVYIWWNLLKTQVQAQSLVPTKVSLVPSKLMKLRMNEVTEKKCENLPLYNSHEESVNVPVGLFHHGVHLVPPDWEDLDDDSRDQHEAQVDATVPEVAIVEVGCRHDNIWRG